MQNKKVGMATHSIVSFDESDSIRLLSKLLEDSKKIKTFFGENDKTPNHDGFFELLEDNVSDENKVPKKQFVVQIKKVSDLQPLISTNNKGKYSYSLCTKFLYYIKAKVTESPAIYFVVDIELKKVFWIYLSDERLMSMNFEGKENVRFYFSEEDIIKSVDDFVAMLHRISDERNEKLPYKSTREIADIQDALDYLNGYLNGDISFIKQKIFPNLWRFGIGSSVDEVTMSYCDSEVQNTKMSNLYSIYPQIKGEIDSGIRDFGSGMLFPHIDMIGTLTHQKYSKNVMSKILKEYFDSAYVLEFAPRKIVREVLNDFVYHFQWMTKTLISESKTHKNINEIETALSSCIDYLIYILDSNHLCESESKFKAYLHNYLLSRASWSRKIDPLSIIFNHGLIDYFNEYRKKPSSLKTTGRHLIMSMDVKYIECHYALKRARELNMKDVEYNERVSYECFKDINHFEHFCDTWFSNLIDIYKSTYDSIFDGKKYLFNNRIVYSLDLSRHSVHRYIHYESAIYESNCLIIERGKKDKCDFSQGAESYMSGFGLSDFIYSNKHLYYSLKCLLYQGIANKLGVECEGIFFGVRNHKIFYIKQTHAPSV
ncbi:MAG: hypothetical protein FWC95_05725 [Defluviitaleaceae bacterium]|nr:hypothetical protein [Defluviitaleaceae bacterium]